MRNRFPGECYRCGGRVEVGKGHFERHGMSWRTQHTECAIKYRGTDQGRGVNWTKEKMRKIMEDKINDRKT